MADVAEEAGVARATVFNHFGTKHALIEGILETILSSYRDLLAQALAQRETPVPDHVRALFEHMGVGIEDDPRFFRSVFREIARVNTGLDEGGAAQHAIREAMSLREQLLTRGQALEQIAKRFPAEDLAASFDSLVFGTITHWLYNDDAQPLHLRMRMAAEIFLGAVACVPAQEGESR